MHRDPIKRGETPKSCEICDAAAWDIQYRGRIRNGTFGNLSMDDCIVSKCSRCGVERLDESACKDEDFYKTEEYRRLLKETEDAAGFMAEHDILQLRNLTVLWPDSVRYRAVVDIGCGAGSFLDHIAGLARHKVAVEPCEAYHDSLEERGYHVYPFAKDAAFEWANKIDFAFCFSVVEHVQNPRAFLDDIRKLLKPKGRLIVSTPNCMDILMDLKGDTYQRFFYRTVHRWYFNQDSFKYCARQAGLEVIESRCIHRFGLSNAIAWLRDGRPTGSEVLKHLNSPMLDSFWKSYVESIGVGDYLYFKLIRES